MFKVGDRVRNTSSAGYTDAALGDVGTVVDMGWYDPLFTGVQWDKGTKGGWFTNWLELVPTVICGGIEWEVGEAEYPNNPNGWYLDRDPVLPPYVFMGVPTRHYASNFPRLTFLRYIPSKPHNEGDASMDTNVYIVWCECCRSVATFGAKSNAEDCISFDHTDSGCSRDDIHVYYGKEMCIQLRHCSIIDPSK